MYISQHASEWQNWSQSLYCYPRLYGTKHVRLQWHHFRQSWGGLRAELQILIRPQSLWAPVSLSVWRLVGLDHFYVSLSPKSLHKSTLIKVWKKGTLLSFFLRDSACTWAHMQTSFWCLLNFILSDLLGWWVLLLLVFPAFGRLIVPPARQQHLQADAQIFSSFFQVTGYM